MRSLTRRGLALEQVSEDNLEIVVCGMSKGAPAVAIAKRPDPRHIRTKALVDLDVAAIVCSYTSRFEAEIVGVGPAADREQHIGADYFGVAFGALNADRDTIGVRRAPVDGHSAQSHSEKAAAGSFLCAHSNQKISGHHGALVAWKIVSACATAPETSS